MLATGKGRYQRTIFNWASESLSGHEFYFWRLIRLLICIAGLIHVGACLYLFLGFCQFFANITINIDATTYCDTDDVTGATGQLLDNFTKSEPRACVACGRPPLEQRR